MNDHELEMWLAEINAREPEDLTKEDIEAIRAAETDEWVALQEFRQVMDASIHSYADTTEEEIMRKLERAREHVKQGLYRGADEVIADMRKKYHLQG